jgi:hypothetical protein
MNSLKRRLHLSKKVPETVYLPKLQQILKQIGQNLLRWLSSNLEPRIWQSKDRKGNISWHIYDPVTAQSNHFSSEAEVRAWIDTQYYRH